MRTLASAPVSFFGCLADQFPVHVVLRLGLDDALGRHECAGAGICRESVLHALHEPLPLLSHDRSTGSLGIGVESEGVEDSEHHDLMVRGRIPRPAPRGAWAIRVTPGPRRHSSPRTSGPEAGIIRNPLNTPISAARSGTSMATCSAITRASVLILMISACTSPG